MKIVSNLVNSVVKFGNRRRAITALNNMSDRQLADIGVNRGDIKNAVRKGGAL